MSDSPTAITVSKIRQDSWVNPFNATSEELMAGALEECGLMMTDTSINGQSARVIYQSYCQKRNLFQETTRLGSLLVKENVITEAQLAKALSLQSEHSIPLGKILTDLRFCTQNEISEALVRQKNIREEIYEFEQHERKRRLTWARIMKFLGATSDDLPPKDPDV